MNLDNIRYSVWNFSKIYFSDYIQVSVRRSVYETVRDSARLSIWDSVGRSARYSVRDSVRKQYESK
jgi:hypothetical protein